MEIIMLLIKKKTLGRTLLLLCILSLSVILAVSCNGNGGQQDGSESVSESQPDSSETTEAICTHEGSTWVTVKPASCSENGLQIKKCPLCNEELGSEELQKLAHTEEIVDIKKPTCTETGLTQGKKCSACGEILVAQEDIPAFGHESSDWIVDSVAGVGVTGKQHKECVRCGERYEENEIPAVYEDHVHKGEKWIESVAPTCKKEGTKFFVCICGYALEEATVEKLPHTEATLLGKDATCLENGLTSGKICLVCDEITVSQSATAKAAHKEEIIHEIPATCTAGGTAEGKKCSVCSTVTVTPVPVPPKGHSYKDGSCSACGMTEGYGIWIVDGLGNPVTDIIVKVMKNGEMVKMYPYKGEYTAFDIEDGEYTVELDLSQTGIDYVYDTESCIISPDHRSTTVRLFKKVEGSMSVFVGDPISKDYNAYFVDQGSYQVSLTPNDYTFFVFRPSVSAIYTVTYECDKALTVSYHGSTFFVQGHDLADSSTDISEYENGLSVNVYPGNVGGDMVFAIKSSSATECILNIKYAGDPGSRLADEPWTPYLEDADKVNQQLAMKGEGTYTAIDVTDLTLSAVFNESDGFYHLNSVDGPIIYIDLTSDSKFISSIQTICAHQRMGVYIYDVNGKIVEKRSFNELFMQYGMPGTAEEKTEEPIRVPLTEKLADAIRDFGSKSSWWSPTSEANIFIPSLLGKPYNQEYAWLLFCGYYQ